MDDSFRTDVSGGEIVLAVKNPELLRRRLDTKEKQEEQGLVVKLSGLMFLLGFVAAGSIYAFVIFLAYPVIIAKRIRYEEEFLENELEGYCEYKQRVRYRLIPLVW